MGDKVVDNLASAGCQYGFGMELDAVYIVVTMAQRHDVPLVTEGGYLQRLG